MCRPPRRSPAFPPPSRADAKRVLYAIPTPMALLREPSRAILAHRRLVRRPQPCARRPRRCMETRQRARPDRGPSSAHPRHATARPQVKPPNGRPPGTRTGCPVGGSSVPVGPPGPNGKCHNARMPAPAPSPPRALTVPGGPPGAGGARRDRGRREPREAPGRPPAARGRPGGWGGSPRARAEPRRRALWSAARVRARPATRAGCRIYC